MDIFDAFMLKAVYEKARDEAAKYNTIGEIPFRIKEGLIDLLSVEKEYNSDWRGLAFQIGEDVETVKFVSYDSNPTELLLRAHKNEKTEKLLLALFQMKRKDALGMFCETSSAANYKYKAPRLARMKTTRPGQSASSISRSLFGRLESTGVSSDEDSSGSPGPPSSMHPRLTKRTADPESSAVRIVSHANRLKSSGEVPYRISSPSSSLIARVVSSDEDSGGSPVPPSWVQPRLREATSNPNLSTVTILGPQDRLLSAGEVTKMTKRKMFLTTDVSKDEDSYRSPVLPSSMQPRLRKATVDPEYSYAGIVGPTRRLKSAGEVPYRISSASPSLPSKGVSSDEDSDGSLVPPLSMHPRLRKPTADPAFPAVSIVSQANRLKSAGIFDTDETSHQFSSSPPSLPSTRSSRNADYTETWVHSLPMPPILTKLTSEPAFHAGRIRRTAIQKQRQRQRQRREQTSASSVLAIARLKSADVVRSKVKWRERSIKHRSNVSKLVKLLRTRPSKAERIGTCRVCFEDEYIIGSGSDGTKVYVGLSDDGYEVAVKCMNFEKGQKLGDNEREILNCPKVRKEKHIVNYRFYQSEDSKKAYLVLDLHEESLREYVQAKERTVEQLQNEGPHIMRQILYGVKALHCSNPEILHRDLKPSNVLVNCEGEMVLTDFGISRTLPEEQTTYKSGVSGTEGWMAAESLPTEEDDDDSLSYADIQVRYKKQSDIQVVGMLCHYILTKGKHPFGTRIHRNSNISKGNFNLREISDPGARDLIEWMIQHDPYKRPSVDECLKHPYLRAPEENFNFVTRVGNEREIKTNDPTSVVVQELNNLPALTKWSEVIDAHVMGYVTTHRRCSYSGAASDLLRFIRNMAVHWHDKPPPLNVQQTVIKPQEYFQTKFPDLPVDLHRIIRKHPNWRNREGLQEFF